MESGREACELQQLVPNDVDGDNDDSIVQEDYAITEGKIISPAQTNIISSEATSHSSVSRNPAPKVNYINEKRKEFNKMTTARPRHVHKVESHNATVRHHCFLSEVPDVRHMEQALLGLLADFHSGKLRAFGAGSTMKQMEDIREQQEKLAKLHFDLGSTSNDPSLSEEGLKHSHNTTAQLIERLEQLSVCIEGLHNSSDKS